MKLFSFDGGRIGVRAGENSYDVTEALGVDPNAWPPVQMVRFIADFGRIGSGIVNHPLAKRIAFPQDRLGVPIKWPNKLLAYPINYANHGEEMSSANRADTHGFFMKANSSLSGPNDPIVLPDLPGREVHHECELAIIVGKTGRHVSREAAMEHIFGYACLIDVVVRGREERVMRKSYDTFCPLGPWIVTADEVGDPGQLQQRLWVNDELRQDGNTRDLIVDVPGMIQAASKVATLYPGDIIASGTPAGVGPLQRGDVVRMMIEKIGEMTLRVI